MSMLSLCCLVIPTASPCPSTMSFLPDHGPETEKQPTMDWNPRKLEGKTNQETKTPNNNKKPSFLLVIHFSQVSVTAARKELSVEPKLLDQIPTKHLSCLKSLSLTQGNSQTSNRYV